MELRDHLVERHGELARRVAQRSPNLHKHATLVLDKKLEVIAAAHNIGSKHSEVRAMLRWLHVYKPRGKVPYMLMNFRANSTGFASAMPCVGCQRFLGRFGIPVEYTISSGQRQLGR